MQWIACWNHNFMTRVRYAKSANFFLTFKSCSTGISMIIHLKAEFFETFSMGFFIFRLILKIGIYSYRPDIKGEIGEKRGEVSKKNQNNFHKTQ